MKGKYLVQNPLLFLFLQMADVFLLLFRSKPKPLKTVKKILLINPAHIGDIVMATSILPALKEQYPNAKIGFICGSWSKEILINHPLVDEVYLIDHWKISRRKESLFLKWMRYRKMRSKALLHIKKEAYDLAIDLYMYFPNFAPLLWQANIPVRVGFESGGFSPLFTHSAKWKNSDCYLPESYRDLLSLLHITSAKLQNTLPTPDTPCPMDNKFIIFHMGTEAEHRKWRIEKWKKLSQYCRKMDHLILFTGKGKREKEEADAVCKEIEYGMNLCGKLSLTELIAYVKEARLVVSVDTSITHIAAAERTPAISLYAGTVNPKQRCPSYSPFVPMMKDLPCSPCYRKKGCTTMRCIREIDPDDVFLHMKRFL